MFTNIFSVEIYWFNLATRCRENRTNIPFILKCKVLICVLFTRVNSFQAMRYTRRLRQARQQHEGGEMLNMEQFRLLLRNKHQSWTRLIPTQRLRRELVLAPSSTEVPHEEEGPSYHSGCRNPAIDEVEDCAVKSRDKECVPFGPNHKESNQQTSSKGVKVETWPIPSCSKSPDL